MLPIGVMIDFPINAISNITKIGVITFPNRSTNFVVFQESKIVRAINKVEKISR